ncbi:MAG: hypothetical protein GF313_11955, partial [Caldithrix sp.]|nr:hypothetical protein [Caldithrix sp.]
MNKNDQELEGKSSNTNCAPIIIAVLATLLIAGGCFYAWQQFNLISMKNEMEAKVLALQSKIDQIQKVEEQIQTEEASPDQEKKEEVKAEEKKTGSEIIKIDDLWSEYTNHDLGFKINYPVKNIDGKATDIIESGDVVYFSTVDNVDYGRVMDQKNEASDYEKAKGIT